ncbi:MAG: penicillin-binding protein 1C [Pedosphaera sp.]|nr:MAG: penicillin-binding protein 1C [Pedosphaera sp.]
MSGEQADQPLGARPWKLRLLLLTALLTFGAWLGISFVPLPLGITEPPASGLEFLDRHGRTLRELRDGQEQFSRTAAEGEIPAVLMQATLAAEDQRFWSHSGVDWRATLRATWQLVRNGRIVSGGSSITQQLVKLAEPRPRTFRTKLVEAAQALRLEREWDKPRILAAYLNRLDYGNLRAGSDAAARHYFDKAPADLSAAEAAFLAGLPQAPSRLNPRARFAGAKRRQEWILGRMHALGWLTSEDFNRALTEPVQLAPPRREFAAPHFVDLLLEREAPDTSRPQRVTTTLDLELNRFVEQTLRSQLARLREQQVGNGAAVVLDNHTGAVLALVGSEDYFAPAAGQVNGAWAPRSAGSTLKPFTYALAFERGATPASIVADVPCEFPTATGVFAPVNYDRHCHGPVRHRLALANSLNIPAVRVLDELGGAAVLHERLRACGMTTLTQPAAHYGLGLTLGNAEVRLLELANAYACLARLGEWRPWRLLERADDCKSPTRVISREAAWLVADVLADNHARALAFGLETPLRFDFPVACKTGTSTDYRDNWAVGYTPEFTVAVWAGNFDGSPMRGVSGVTGAGPVLHTIFQNLRARFGTTWFEPPTGWVQREVHPLTGKLVTEDARRSLAKDFASVREWFPPNRLPPVSSAADFDASGRVLLPSEYRAWFQSGDNGFGDRVALATRPQFTSLRVLSPVPGTVFYLDPDLPDSARRIALHASGGRECRWESESLTLDRAAGLPQALLTEGRHRLTVHDLATGTRAETWVEVRKL